MENFDDIRPYTDAEVVPTIERLLKDPEFKRVVHFIMPDIDWPAFVTKMKTFTNIHDFQHTMVKDIVVRFLQKAAKSIGCAGLENISVDAAYTFISNHRDIVLDSSILCVLLAEHGFDTTEIAIGDNLLIQPWIIDVVRLNKSFIVKRGGSMHQIFEASMHLSKYIHYAITQKHQSIWIAQREGRAKNSDDRTQESLLKMLSMGGDGDFLKSIEALNITPVSLSYEYDPCDYLKAKEFQQKRDNPEFKKSPHDDLVNMETGLFGFKGKIHFQIGRPVNRLLSSIDATAGKNAIIASVAALIDKEIFLNYKLFPLNYIAYDRLWGAGKLFDNAYTPDDEKEFDVYMQKKLELIDLPDKDISYLSEKFMEMYAYPVKNYLSVKQ